MTAKEAMSRIYLHGKTMLEEEALVIIDALEKQVPQKPRLTRYALMCARCGHKITEIGCAKKNRRYCKKCGQAIDWEEDTGG